MKKHLNHTREEYCAARACTLFFILSAFVSYCYTIKTGTYNGDFYGIPETLGFWWQTCLLFFALLPYLFAWQLYKFFKARQQHRTIPLTQRALTSAYFLFVVWFIFLAIKYGVGVMGQPIYEAPAMLKPIIQISNRINPYYLGVLFILMYRGTRILLFFGIILLIALGITRAGLGVFLYIFLALAMRNYLLWKNYIWNNKFIILIIMIVFPMVVGELYSLRSTLRKDAVSDITMTATEIITARLIGRLSSFSDSSYIIQESAYFEAEAHGLDHLYFAHQVLGSILGVAFMPENTPERILGGNLSNTSFMAGLPGNLYLSWLISPLIFILNLALVFIMCLLVFIISRKIRTPFANEFALLILLYPLTSGAGNEFSSVVVAFISLGILFLVLSSISACCKIVGSNIAPQKLTSAFSAH